jgi:uncharacterized protein (TIRG00374 family)
VTSDSRGPLGLRVGLTFVILAYLLSRIDVRQAAVVLLTVDLGYLALVLLLVGLDRVVMIGRWALLLWSSEHDVSLKSAAWMFLVSSFVGSALPAGVGGDAARAYVLSRRTSATAEAVASVAVDRILGVVGIALLGVAGLIAWSRQVSQTESVSLSWLLPLATLMVAASAAALWADKLATTSIPRRWRQSAGMVKLLRLGDAIARYRQRPGTLALVVALSVGVQWLRIVQAYLLGVGLDIDVPFKSACPLGVGNHHRGIPAPILMAG